MNILRKVRKPIAVTLAVAMALFSVPIVPAQAAIVGTDRILKSPDTARARVEAFLSRKDVEAQLRALGVSPAEAKARVNALSDNEVANIAGKIDSMPAGQGIVGAVVGAFVLVFLVLLVTDLLGLTHVFGFTNKGSLRAAR